MIEIDEYLVKVYKHRKIAKLKRVTSIVDGQLDTPEFFRELEVAFATAVEVPARVDDVPGTMGSCMTLLDDELWALEYELPPPRT